MCYSTQGGRNAESAGGHVVDLEPMLDDYYQITGWDPAGVPTPARLNDLGILEKLGTAKNVK